jgi:hypothetical protein
MGRKNKIEESFNFDFFLKKIGNQKKGCTFVPSSPKTTLMVFVCVAFFIATETAGYAANIRLSIFNGCCATKPVIVFGEMKKGSLSSFNKFNFSSCQRQ